MAVSLDKVVPAQRTSAGAPVSLHKPSGGDAAARTGSGAPAGVPADVLPRPNSDTSAAGGAPRGPRRHFGRPALVAASIAGVVLAGAAGASAASGASSERNQLRTELAAAQADNNTLGQLRTELAAAQADNDTLDVQLATATRELTDTSGQLEQAESRADDVSSRESMVASTEAGFATRSVELDERQAALDARSRALDTMSSSLKSREAAINSPDVGHPLAETIDADGVWVVGRDIKAGTWMTGAYDTGCTWKVSDGRSGAGDGSYNQMEVEVSSGQKFTVRGCTLWINFSY